MFADLALVLVETFELRQTFVILVYSGYRRYRCPNRLRLSRSAYWAEKFGGSLGAHTVFCMDRLLPYPA